MVIKRGHIHNKQPDAKGALKFICTLICIPA